jgi:hypothetical protein
MFRVTRKLFLIVTSTNGIVNRVASEVAVNSSSRETQKTAPQLHLRLSRATIVKIEKRFYEIFIFRIDEFADSKTFITNTFHYVSGFESANSAHYSSVSRQRMSLAKKWLLNTEAPWLLLALYL